MNKKLLFVLTILIVIGLVILINGSDISSDQKKIGESSMFQNKSKKYVSEAMEFTIEVPSSIQAVQGSESDVILIGSTGNIQILRSGTNYQKLQEYLNDSRMNINNQTTKKENLTISGLDAMRGFQGKNKVYLIYAPLTVYVLETSEPALYEVLDQIAQSFRYIGK